MMNKTLIKYYAEEIFVSKLKSVVQGTYTFNGIIKENIFYKH